MRNLRMRLLGGLLIAVAATACGPVWMIPGGELSGQAAPLPSDWAFSDAVDTVQLETRPVDPYSVNIWGVGIGDSFYIAAGDPSNSWAKSIADNPDVRLKIGDSIFELRAERIGDDAEIETFLTALQRKYDYEVDPEDRDKATVYRLGPRSSR